MRKTHYTYAGAPLERTGLLVGKNSYWAYVISGENLIARSCQTKDPAKAIEAYNAFWEEFCDEEYQNHDNYCFRKAVEASEMYNAMPRRERLKLKYNKEF